MSKKVQIYWDSFGPAINKSVSVAELEEYKEKGWKVAGGQTHGGREVAELSKQEAFEIVGTKPDPNSETVAELQEAQEVFSRRGGVWEEFAQEELGATPEKEEKSLDSMWQEARSDFEDMVDEAREKEKEERIEKLKEEYGDVLLPDHLSKPIGEMTGEEYLKLQNEIEDTSYAELEEELEAEIREIEGLETEEAEANEEESTPDLDEEVIEEMEAAWTHRSNSAWATSLAELKPNGEADKTHVEKDGKKATVTTRDSQLKQELLNKAEEYPDLVDITELSNGDFISADIEDRLEIL
ncbi:hypothetical protein [Halorubrum vacuolatum]|uniref:Uncharacterized protein n=1 Tax=Halorubrum vacuolatum TaxID=63740 RepID=A0A238VYN0_HALVU|nr:hypothetical protein [Halorubrum vacuolatum]SNR39420.1 hypothetical protein SAMN06264855_104227 [Halorubrum vacuolatum]